jgi:hypothetical protein
MDINGQASLLNSQNETKSKVGSKRKGNDLEAPIAKKRKLEVGFGPENDFAALPDDCWETIASHMLFDCSSVLYFVAKRFREIYFRALHKKLSNQLGIPINTALLVPKDVKRYFSRIDVLVLLEKALDSAKARQVNSLLEVSTALEKLISTVIAEDVEFSIPVLLWEDKKMVLPASEGEIARIAQFPAIRTNIINHTLATLFDGTDGEMSLENKKSFFVWFGKNNKYIRVTFNGVYGSCKAEGQWLRLEFNTLLKKLDSDEEQQVVISFNSRARGIKYNLSGREANDDDDAEYEDDYWIRYIDPEMPKTVCQWLEQDMDPLKFILLLHYMAEATYGDIYKEKTRYLDLDIKQVPVWDGNFIDEFQRVLRVYLNNNNNNWKNEILVSVRRIIGKLKIMERIKKKQKYQIRLVKR